MIWQACTAYRYKDHNIDTSVALSYLGAMLACCGIITLYRVHAHKYNMIKPCYRYYPAMAMIVQLHKQCTERFLDLRTNICITDSDQSADFDFNIFRTINIE